MSMIRIRGDKNNKQMRQQQQSYDDNVDNNFLFLNYEDLGMGRPATGQKKGMGILGE